MNINFKHLMANLAIIIIPLIYLGYVWTDLPDQVPMHFNASGEVDRFGSKMELVALALLMPTLIYLIMLVAPKLDPKRKIDPKSSKYRQLTMLLVASMSLLAIYVINAAQSASLAHPNLLFIGCGVLYMVLGNYFKTIKPNYFVGIRSPWALENQTVWRKTHDMGGKLWFVGGFCVTVVSFFARTDLTLIVLFTITGIITIVPFVYSYLVFRNLKSE